MEENSQNPEGNPKVENEKHAGPEIRRVQRLLRGIANIARESSMTGVLKNGRGSCVQQYNHIVQHLENGGAIVPDFFPRLVEESSLDDVGVAASLLAEYLEEEEEPGARRGEERGQGFRFRIKRELGDLIRNEIAQAVRVDLGEKLGGVFDIKLGGFREGREGEEGQAQREYRRVRVERVDREQHRQEARGERERRQEGETQSRREGETGGGREAEPERERDGEKEARRAEERARMGELEARLAEAAARFQFVAQEVGRVELTADERGRLVEELARLAQEQADLAQQHTRLREFPLQ